MGYARTTTRGTHSRSVSKWAQISLAFCLVVGVFGGAALPAGAETLPELEDFQNDSDEPRAAPYVFNGEPVSNPGWIASILGDGDFFCTASLIHSEWVLTAAHCVDDASFTYSVNVGSAQWNAGTNRQISEIFIHPGYNPAEFTSVDLAMLKMSAPVAASSLPKLSASSSWPALNQQLVVAGWGQTSTGSPPANTLQAGTVFVDSNSSGTVNEDWCFRPWVSDSGYEDFCFGGDSWACPGDSGGPLVGLSSPTATTGAIDTIYGITSFGSDEGCSEISVDTVAQRVGTHIGWISSFLPPPPTPPSPGDVADEMFFYRDDGLFRYYNVKSNGSLGVPILAGDGYTTGWSSITAVDLDGDGQDEMFFYREDGLFRFYNVKPDGSLGLPILAGSGYTKGWSAITAVDLDGDGQDEMFFYRDDGLFRYYNVKPSGSVGSPILAGSGYTKGWSAITAVQLDLLPD